MATLSPQISDAGISGPDFPDVLQQLKISLWAIFGSDANFDPDSQDGQAISVFAQAIYDAGQMAIAAYNGFSPATAQGAGLSSVVKINGLQRHIPSNSEAVITIVGVAGTIITGGVVGDNAGLNTRWALPDVTIPITGTTNVTASAEQLGAVAAAAGSLTQILTPTLGWQSATNAAAAVLGSPVETDAQLRKRQSRSTSLPARSVYGGIYAAVANVATVERLAIIENDTDSTDVNGIPSHSIAVVAEGGNVTEIANAIAVKKSPGTGTFGTTVLVVIDEHGVPSTIRFYLATEVRLLMHIIIQAQPGYVSTTGDIIKQNLVDFIRDLEIGEDSYLSRLYSPINLGGTGLGSSFVTTSVLQSRNPAAPAAANIVIAFNEVATLAIEDITLTVT
jgi:uncharacterized phage protein gp47/JayE